MVIFNKKRLIVALFAMAGLLILTHIPPKHMPDGLDRFDLDKILHIFAYAVLTALMIMAIRPPRGLIAKLGVLIILLFLAIADETTQAFVGRCTSNADLMADIIGMFIAMALSFSWVCKIATGKSQP
jgi:VanZ family protein